VHLIFIIRLSDFLVNLLTIREMIHVLLVHNK
jgi:hypothetical protein